MVNGVFSIVKINLWLQVVDLFVKKSVKLNAVKCVRGVIEITIGLPAFFSLI